MGAGVPVRGRVRYYRLASVSHGGQRVRNGTGISVPFVVTFTSLKHRFDYLLYIALLKALLHILLHHNQCCIIPLFLQADEFVTIDWHQYRMVDGGFAMVYGDIYAFR